MEAQQRRGPVTQGRKQSGDAGRPGQQPRAREPVRTGLGGDALTLLRLQRALGNAATVQLLHTAGLLPLNDGSARAPETSLEIAAGRPDASPAGSTVPDVLSRPGRPLPETVRREMQSRFGTDFEDVRLHDDRLAARSAEEIGARAYTSGSHVVLGRGGADAFTLAHELAHVVQQRRGAVTGHLIDSGLTVSDPDDAFERAADATAARAMRMEPFSRVQEPPSEVPSRAAEGAAAVARNVVQRLVAIEYSKYRNDDSVDPSAKITKVETSGARDARCHHEPSCQRNTRPAQRERKGSDVACCLSGGRLDTRR